MRVLSSAISRELETKLASEPIVIIGIDWVDGETIFYSDQKLNGEDNPKPQIISVGGMNTSIIVSGSGDSQSVSITLDDIDGDLRRLIDIIDMQKRPVSIYLGFQGLPLVEKVLMFRGNVQTPIVWGEGDRTLSFDVYSELDSPEVGFTMEDGTFPFIPPAERNRAWPLVFGKVCNMETVKVTAPRKGFLAEGQGVIDPTIEERLCQAKFLTCADITPTEVIDPETFLSVGFNNPDSPRANKPDQSCLNRKFNEECAILRERAQQQQYVKTQLTIRGGEGFPQNQEITISVGSVRFTGGMVGELFTITFVYHPDMDNIDNPPCLKPDKATSGFRWKPNQSPSSLAACDDGTDYDFDNNIVGGAGESWRYYNLFKKGHFIWLPPGSEVLLFDEADLIHIVSLLPGTVIQVAAYREFESIAILTEVDTELYSVQTVDYKGYDVVELHLPTLLSQLDDSSWDDTIYVTFESSVGPNPVDVIEYLVEKYTDLTIDTTNFDAVKTQMANYSVNFALKSRERVLDLIKDVAYQSRMGVIVRDDTISLVYLSTEPTSVRTITEDDILVGSFVMSHTDTDDLITRHQINWQETEAEINRNDDVELEFVLKHNIPKYGTIEEEYDYFCHNVFKEALKTSTFWLIRKAHTWRLIEFQLPLRHLDLDVFDAITINIAQFPNIKCVVSGATVNLTDNTVHISCWTPVLSGTTEEYFWAWPALQDPAAIFPISGTTQSGDGYDFTVEPPEGHPLRGDLEDGNTIITWTDGDRNPSDLDDVICLPECRVATGQEIAEDLEPVLEPFEPLADEQFADGQDGKNGQSVSSEDKEEKKVCGKEGIGNTGCIYEVHALYVIPRTVTTVKGSGCTCKCAGPCKGDGGRMGRVCTGSLTSTCHSFGALWAAQAFAAQKEAEAQALHENCAYTVGVRDIYVGSANTIKAVEAVDPIAGGCDPVFTIGDSAAGGAMDGETMTTADVK